MPAKWHDTGRAIVYLSQKTMTEYGQFRVAVLVLAWEDVIAQVWLRTWCRQTGQRGERAPIAPGVACADTAVCRCARAECI